MGNRLVSGVRASVIAEHLGLSWSGIDIEVTRVGALSDADAGVMCFSNRVLPGPLTVSALAIAAPDSPAGAGCVIAAPSPRLAFVRALQFLDARVGFRPRDLPGFVDPTATISPSATIGPEVRIGARTVVRHNVVIAGDVTIGDDCFIKSGAVIGEEGFGFERDENSIPVRMLHVGRVVIGNRVEIGTYTTVIRATLGDTTLEDDVKVDDHVHVGHNVMVRRGTLLTACSELSGGVEVGEFSWVGPNSTVIQKVTLGARSFVGIGSNVLKSVPAGATVAGNPARVISPR